MNQNKLSYCSYCGSKLKIYSSDTGDVSHYQCSGCDEIYKIHPLIIAGCIAEYEDKILLCKRAIEPRIGYWTFPSGYMENNETVMQAAIRETAEEANAFVTDTKLYALINCPRVNQVHAIVRGKMKNSNMSPGLESSEVGFFNEITVPWSELAFSVIEQVLIWYFEDKHNREYIFHTTSTYDAYLK